MHSQIMHHTSLHHTVMFTITWLKYNLKQQVVWILKEWLKHVRPRSRDLGFMQI